MIVRKPHLLGLRLKEHTLCSHLCHALWAHHSRTATLHGIDRLCANAALANMPALKMLDLSANELTGSLPVDWSGANNLIMLLLSNNSFSGRPLHNPAMHSHTKHACCMYLLCCSHEACAITSFADTRTM